MHSGVGAQYEDSWKTEGRHPLWGSLSKEGSGERPRKGATLRSQGRVEEITQVGRGIRILEAAALAPEAQKRGEENLSERD